MNKLGSWFRARQDQNKRRMLPVFRLLFRCPLWGGLLAIAIGATGFYLTASLFSLLDGVVAHGVINGLAGLLLLVSMTSILVGVLVIQFRFFGHPHIGNDDDSSDPGGQSSGR